MDLPLAYAQLAPGIPRKSCDYRLPAAAALNARASSTASSVNEVKPCSELRHAAGPEQPRSVGPGNWPGALWSDRKYEEAIQILTPLVASSPDQPEWQFELGDALFSLGKPEEAVGHLQKAVSLAPDLLSAQAKLGGFCCKPGMPQALYLTWNGQRVWIAMARFTINSPWPIAG